MLEEGDKVYVRKMNTDRVITWRGWLMITALHSGNYDYQYTGRCITTGGTVYFDVKDIQFL